jgi:hypothetical protein
MDRSWVHRFGLRGAEVPLSRTRPTEAGNPVLGATRRSEMCLIPNITIKQHEKGGDVGWWWERKRASRRERAARQAEGRRGQKNFLRTRLDSQYVTDFKETKKIGRHEAA